jgi:PAS domain S-box-containing protein
MDLPPLSSADEDRDLPRLIHLLQEIEGKIQRLTDGQVDAVVDAAGQSHLLHKAQAQLISSERTQRQLTDLLRLERARLTSAQALAHIGSWVIFMDSGLIEWSDETYRIFQMEVTAFRPTYEKVLELVHPDDRNLVDERCMRLLQEGKDGSLEHRIYLPGGIQKYVEQRWQIERNEQGEPIRAIGTCQDMTERKRSEQQLRESQALLSIASRLGRIGAWSMDLSRQAVTWSDEVCDIHEVPRRTSPSFAEALLYYPLEWRETIRQACLSCASGGKPFDLQLEIISASGQRLWIRAIGEATRDSSGAIYGIQGAFQDLSAQRSAEQETRRLATRLTATLESLTVGFFTLDHHWRFTYFNAEAERMLGRRREKVLGTEVWDEFQELLGTDFEEYFRNAVRQKRSNSVEGFFAPAHAWCQATVYPSEEGLAVYVRDISVERAEHEQLKLLEASVSQLNDIILITEAAPLERPGPRIQFVNEAYVRYTGYSREEAIGGSPRQLQGPLTDRVELDRIRAALERGESVHTELINYRKNAEPFWLEMDIVPVGETGRPSHFVAVARDITERKRDQDALRELNAELEARVISRTAELEKARAEAEAANKAKSIFLATMSHEIRTPMNGVAGLIEVLQEANLPPAESEVVDIIQDSADSLLKIIDDILDFSKIEAGKLNIERVPMDLSDLVERVCSLLDPMARSKGVSISVFVDPRIPPAMLGDELRIRQVLSNLIGNAVKFSSGGEAPGRVSVRAELVRKERNAATVNLTIADNGIGIDQETLRRLFTPFSQADPSTTRRFGGTGLGLAISDMLVRLMAGDIRARSILGDGSAFTVQLNFDVIPTALDGRDAGLGGMQCRIIGNDQQLAADLTAHLRSAGASVEQFTNLESAASKSQRGLVLWLILPGQPLPPLPGLRALGQNNPDAETRFVAFAHGRRRNARFEAPDFIRIDVDALTRETLFRTLAMAAGRVPQDRQPQGTAALSGREGSAEAPYALAGRNILVAEDNETNRAVMQRQLQAIGFGAEFAVDGGQALERWRTGRFALLLTDLRMPTMDGYELTAAIRAEEGEGRHMPIIAFTANALSEEEAACRSVGMDDYLVKPVRLERLRETLEKWLTFSPVPVDDVSGHANSSSKPADLSVLVSLIGNSPSGIKSVLSKFRSTAEKCSEQMNHWIGIGAAEAAADPAHRLKSAALSIGANKLGELCAEMELAAEKGQGDRLQALLPQFNAELSLVGTYLQSVEAQSFSRTRPFSAASGSSPTD